MSSCAKVRWRECDAYPSVVVARHRPAPARGKRMPWKTFLRTHLGAIAAAGLFSVELLTLTGLVRYLVLFVIGPWQRAD
jgi:hypothetical protein